MSPTTFYAKFRDKQDALMAAIDSAGAQMVAAILPAFRRAPEWQRGMRAAFGAFFNFLASRPRAGATRAGRGLCRRPGGGRTPEQALQPLEALLAEGRAHRRSAAPRLETIGAAIYALTYSKSADSAPIACLAWPRSAPTSPSPPFRRRSGVRAANGDGRGRVRTSDS